MVYCLLVTIDLYTSLLPQAQIKYGVLVFKTNASFTFKTESRTCKHHGGVLCVFFVIFSALNVMVCGEVIQGSSFTVKTASVLQLIQPHTATKQAWLRL